MFDDMCIPLDTLSLRDGHMGAPRILRWGVQNRIRERSERKKIFCTPTFPNVGGTSKQISVGAY